MHEPGWRLIDLPAITDPRGNLSVLERGEDVPFVIQRVFYSYDVPDGETRAGHALEATEQILVAVSGSFDVGVDDGSSGAEFTLDRPNLGLYLAPRTWREVGRFTPGAVCLVLASTSYHDTVYHRDRDAWRQLTSRS